MLWVSVHLLNVVPEASLGTAKGRSYRTFGVAEARYPVSGRTGFSYNRSATYARERAEVLRPIPPLTD